jgi:hypothetical protein
MKKKHKKKENKICRKEAYPFNRLAEEKEKQASRAQKLWDPNGKVPEESQPLLNTAIEMKKFEAQNKNEYRGKQGPRAYKSYVQH